MSGPLTQRNPNDAIKKLGTKDYERYSYLRRVLDTNEDTRIVLLTLNAIRTLDVIWKNKDLSLDIKWRMLNTYAKPLMLYNREVWYLITVLDGQMNAFRQKEKHFMTRWARKLKI